MKLKVQLIVCAEDGREEQVSEVAMVEKSHQQIEHLGFTLAEAKRLLATLQQQLNWLRVLGTAELSQIDQGVRQQFHAKMSLLQVFKPEQQPLEFVLPRKGSIHTSSQGIDDF